MVVTRDQGKGIWEIAVQRVSSLIMQDEKVLEIIVLIVNNTVSYS